MAKYRGPVCRLCRREGEKLFLKGERCFTPKCAVERRGYAPGQHGKSSQFRRKRDSDIQLIAIDYLQLMRSRSRQAENSREREIPVESFEAMLREMVQKLEAQTGHLEMSFPYFINKEAPVSKVKSLLDYEVSFTGEILDGDQFRQTTRVIVPATSLCPCSKKISERGAHNQRSHITITATTNSFVWIEEIVQMAEGQASCELYGLLKRPDEKHVTERAYDNPKFVEDIVRDVAGVLNADPRIDAYTVESENFESIHNHSAYALIEKDKRA